MIFAWIVTYLVTGNYYKRDIIDININECVEDMKKRERNIRIVKSPYIRAPVTIGIVKPIILLPLNNEEYVMSIKGIIRHELKHISSVDGLFRFFIFIIIAMEWYNPLVYYLLKESIAVSEMLCDEAAVEGMSKEEKTNYMRCIVEAVGKTKGSETIIMSIGKEKGLSMERMKRIMGKSKKKVWKKSLSVGIMIFCFLVSAVPALAYEEPRNIKKQ